MFTFRMGLDGKGREGEGRGEIGNRGGEARGTGGIGGARGEGKRGGTTAGRKHTSADRSRKAGG